MTTDTMNPTRGMRTQGAHPVVGCALREGPDGSGISHDVAQSLLKLDYSNDRGDRGC
jgi:hypothetical protein